MRIQIIEMKSTKVHTSCTALMRDNDYMASTIVMLEYRRATLE